MTRGLALACAMLAFLVPAAARAQTSEKAQPEAPRQKQVQPPSQDDQDRDGARPETQRQMERQREGETPMMVDILIVISRLKGEKKVSNLPYSMTLSATENAAPGTGRLRISRQVPVPVSAGSFQYREVGMSIDASARRLTNGRFAVFLAVEENSMSAPPVNPTVDASPSVSRKFTSNNTLVLKDKETKQLLIATDQFTGEVVKIDVTLNVAK